MDYKEENEFGTEEEYVAYSLTLLIGELMNLNNEERGEIWEFVSDYIENTGELDAEDFTEIARQVKVVIGIKELPDDGSLKH